MIGNDIKRQCVIVTLFMSIGTKYYNKGHIIGRAGVRSRAWRTGKMSILAHVTCQSSMTSVHKV